MISTDSGSSRYRKSLKMARVVRMVSALIVYLLYYNVLVCVLEIGERARPPACGHIKQKATLTLYIL